MWCGLVMLVCLGCILTSNGSTLRRGHYQPQFHNSPQSDPFVPNNGQIQACQNRLFQDILMCRTILGSYPGEADPDPLGNIVEECCLSPCTGARFRKYCATLLRKDAVSSPYVPVTTTTTTTPPPPPPTTPNYFINRLSRKMKPAKSRTEKHLEDAITICLNEPNCDKSQFLYNNSVDMLTTIGGKDENRRSTHLLTVMRKIITGESACFPRRRKPLKPSSLLRLLIGILNAGLPQSTPADEPSDPKPGFRKSDLEEESKPQWGNFRFENDREANGVNGGGGGGRWGGYDTNQNAHSNFSETNGLASNLVDNENHYGSPNQAVHRTTATQQRKFGVPWNSRPRPHKGGQMTSVSDPPLQVSIGFPIGVNDGIRFNN